MPENTTPIDPAVAIAAKKAAVEAKAAAKLLATEQKAAAKLALAEQKAAEKLAADAVTAEQESAEKQKTADKLAAAEQKAAAKLATTEAKTAAKLLATEQKAAEKLLKTVAAEEADAAKKVAAEEAKAAKAAKRAERATSAPAPRESTKIVAFNLAQSAEIKNHRPGTKRAMVVEMLTAEHGATFAEIMVATGWDRKTAYEGVRLCNLFLGYGMKTDPTTHKIVAIGRFLAPTPAPAPEMAAAA